MSAALRLSGQKWLSRLFRRLGDQRPLSTTADTLSTVIRHRGDPLHRTAILLSKHIQAFVEGTSDCVIFLDPQWRFTFFNRRAAEELRIGPEFIGVSIWEAFPDAVGTAIEHRYRRAMTEHTLEIFEEYFEPLSAWFEIHVVPIADGGLTVIFRNISARRAAAEALRTRERQLATVFSQTVVGIMHRDLNYNVLMINERYCEIVGRSREELNGLPMEAFTHPDDLERSIAVFQEHLQTGEPFQIEKRYIRPDGSAIWCDVNVSFVRDDTGRVVSTITVAEDIHSRKLAEEKAHESQRLLQVVIDSIQDLVFVKDREGRFVFANQRLTEGCGPLQGVRAQDCVSQDLSALYEESDRYVLDSGETCTIEEVIPTRGEPRRFQTVKVPWRRDGEIIGVIGVSRDLTERLEAEAELIESRRQLATLIDNLPGLVYRCSVGAPWTFSFMSEGAEALTGYRTQDFVEQRLTWGDITHPDDLAFVEEATLQHVAQHKVYSVAYRIIDRSGEVRWVHDRGQGVYDSSGQAIFLEGIISDVTAQKEAEERTIWLAHHDSLTQLPNRLLFQIRLEEALSQAEATGRKVGLLLLDVDHLKEINDMLGHSAGDAVLQAVAERLRASIRSIDTPARNGGDEFAIVMPDLSGREDIEARSACRSPSGEVAKAARLCRPSSGLPCEHWCQHLARSCQGWRKSAEAGRCCVVHGQGRRPGQDDGVRAVHANGNAAENADARQGA
jgi:PAS domain S-box-containing protein